MAFLILWKISKIKRGLSFHYLFESSKENGRGNWERASERERESKGAQIGVPSCQKQQKKFCETSKPLTQLQIFFYVSWEVRTIIGDFLARIRWSVTTRSRTTRSRFIYHKKKRKNKKKLQILLIKIPYRKR